MGEAKRRQAAGRLAPPTETERERFIRSLPAWHTHPDEWLAQLADRQPGILSLKIGGEGEPMDVHNTAAVVVHYQTAMPWKTPFFWFDGYAGESRSPEEVPGIAAYVVSLAEQVTDALVIDTHEWIQDLEYDTHRLMLRCHAKINLAPCGQIIGTNPRPIRWRFCDIPKGSPR